MTRRWSKTGFELSVPSRGSWRRLIDGGDDLRCHALDALISAPGNRCEDHRGEKPARIFGGRRSKGTRHRGRRPKIPDDAIIGDIALRGGVNFARIWQSSDGSPTAMNRPARLRLYARKSSCGPAGGSLSSPQFIHSERPSCRNRKESVSPPSR
jgi:hypothetical protein